MAVLPYLALLWVSTQSAPAPLAASPHSVTTMTACLAVTRAEVEAAMGRPLGSPKERNDRGASSCEYQAADGQVTISIYRASQKLNLTAEIKHLRKSIPEATVREVSGLGTRAFFMDMAAVGTQLHVLRGDYDYVLVSVLGFGGATEVAPAAAQIARHALGRF